MVMNGFNFVFACLLIFIYFRISRPILYFHGSLHSFLCFSGNQFSPTPSPANNRNIHCSSLLDLPHLHLLSSEFVHCRYHIIHLMYLPQYITFKTLLSDSLDFVHRDRFSKLCKFIGISGASMKFELLSLRTSIQWMARCF